MTATLPIRQNLASLPGYVPGRRPDEAGFPDGARLASNESPFDPLPSVRAAMADALGESNRYPDMACAGLIDAIAGFVREEPGRIAVGNGSSALIRDLVATLAGPGDEVVFAVPSFPYYRNATIAAGATPVAVPLAGHRHDLSAMAAALTPHTRIVFVCNPNNPTGTTVDPRELAEFVERVPGDVAVVIDEAYIEFCAEGTDSLELARCHPNVVILRTFSKAYGLAGLRVGYLVGPGHLVENLRRVAVPFGVNAVAQAGARASLEPAAQRELAGRNGRLVAERGRMQAKLGEAGLPVVASGANFVFLPLGQRSASFVGHCEAHGVMVRGLGDGVRITVGTPAENEKTLDAVRSWPAS